MDADPVIPDPQHDSGGSGCGARLAVIAVILLLTGIVVIYFFWNMSISKSRQQEHAQLDRLEARFAKSAPLTDLERSQLPSVFGYYHDLIDESDPNLFETLTPTFTFSIDAFEIYLLSLELDVGIRDHASSDAVTIQGARDQLSRLRRFLVDAPELAHQHGWWEIQQQLTLAQSIFPMTPGVPAATSTTVFGHVSVISGAAAATGISVTLESLTDALKDFLDDKGVDPAAKQPGSLLEDLDAFLQQRDP